MPYIALKPVRFDRDYIIGESIPDDVVNPGRAADLQAMKLIAAVPAAPTAEPEQPEQPEQPGGPQKPAGAAESAEGVNTHPDAETPAGETTAANAAAKKPKAKK